MDFFTENVVFFNETLQQNTNVTSDDSDFEFAYNITEIFGPKRDPLYVVIPITFIYMVIFISGVIGNISTCIVISKNKSMHTATNYYLFSLAVSDFLLLLSGVPQEMYSIWSKYPYVFGEIFCVLRGLAAETSANATVLTITAFTVERYVAICHPFLSHTMSKLSRAVKLILLVWIVSVALAIPQALQFGVMNMRGIEQCGVKRIIIEHSFELSTFLFFFAPMSLITVLYVLIGLKLRMSSFMPRTNGVTVPRRPINSSRAQQNSQGTKRVLKMLVAVVVAFFLCWAPFHAQRLVAIYGTGNEHLRIYVVMTYISGILYYLSTCINPLLYHIMSNKFREAFKETLANCCQVPSRHHDKKRAYRVLSRRQRNMYGPTESTDYSVFSSNVTGSSVRDESLYSTSTQKQSFDSVTLSRKQSVNVVQLRNNFGLFNENTSPVATGGIQLSTINSSNGNQYFKTNFSPNDDLQRNIDNNRRYPNDDSIERITQKPLTASNGINNVDVPFNLMKKEDVKISGIVIKPKSTSRLRIFFQNLTNWRQTTNRNVGYYSPPINHQIAVEKLNFQIETAYSCEARADSDEGNGRPTIEQQHIDAISMDDGVISNSSMTMNNMDKAVLEDELSAYMAEVRMREKQ